jgi:hypothetical protein
MNTRSVARLLLASAFTIAAACGSPSPSDSSGANETVRLHPNQQSGTILVSAPAGATLPEWSGTSTWGFGYSPTQFHVLTTSGNSVVAGNLGTAVKVPHGSYQIVFNDTTATVAVAPQQQTEVKASRIEVADVSGTYTLALTSGGIGYSGARNLLNAKLPTGVGINVLAGDYTASISYQSAQKTMSARVDAGATALVQPADLRGNILVNAPTAALPDWSGTSTWGFGYNNGVYQILNSSGGSIASGKVGGDPVAVPEGGYKLVLNDTQMDITVTRQQTTTVYGGRVEVDTTDVSGSFTISLASGGVAYSGARNLLNAKLPLGVGIDVLPGSYTANVAYDFGGSDSFAVVVDNTP